MKDGATMESFVAHVYQNLLHFSGCDTVISTNISVKGFSGVVHEFDVYYEFYHLNILFREAIECKDWDSPVDKGRVQEFWAKIDDLNRVAGVMIAKSGYQSGAIQFAKAKGLMLLTLEDLPTFPQIVAEKLQRLLLPDETAIGEPFWTIMQREQNGMTTGNYFDLHQDGKTQILLFFSKPLAVSFWEHIKDQDNWCVRGVSQAQMRALVDWSLELNGHDFGLCLLPTNRDLQMQFLLISAQESKENYCSV